MGESGGALIGLGGGYHLGRKMFVKIKDARSKAKELIEKANGEQATSNETAPKQHLEKANGDEDQQQGDQIESKMDKTTLDDSQGGGVMEKQPEIPVGEGEVSLVPPEPKTKIPTLDDSGTDITQEYINTPLLDKFTSSDSGQNISDAFKQAKNESSGVLDSAIPETLPNNAIQKITEGGDSLLEKAKGVKNTVSSTIDDIKGGVADLKGQVTEKVGSIVGEDAMKIASKVGEVADFLGPAGEIVGAGLALGSFFHNIFDKKRLDREQDEAENKTGLVLGSGGGISTASLAQSSMKSNTVGTLV